MSVGNGWVLYNLLDGIVPSLIMVEELYHSQTCENPILEMEKNNFVNRLEV